LGITIGSGSSYKDNILIQNNNIHGIGAGPAIYVWATNSKIDGNYFHDFEHDPMQLWGHDITISNNEVYNLTDDSGDHVDFIQTFGDNGDYAYNVIVEKNFVHDSLCTAFMLSQDNVANIRNWTFRNNIFANLEYHAQAGIPYVALYNNVFYNYDIYNQLGVTFPVGGAYGGTNGTVKNNIFMNNGNASYGFYIVDSGGKSTFIADYNYVADTSYGVKYAPDFTETHGINGGNPGLVNKGGTTAASYALTSLSRLIDKGTAITGFSTDYAGTSRPQGSAWDIGAYEYVYGGSDTTPPSPPSGVKVN